MAPPKPPVAIIGSGNMGRAIGIAISRTGHPVFFAGRNPTDAPKRAVELAKKAPGSTTVESGTIASGARFGTILIWTSRETTVANVLGTDGVSALREKSAKTPITVLDCNNWDFEALLQTGVGAALDRVALGERLQAGFEDAGVKAHVFKAFNTLPMELFALDQAALRRADVQVYLASVAEGVPTDVRESVVEMVRAMGFAVVDLGAGPRAARMAEVMADVIRYCLSMGVGNGGWSHVGVHGVPEGDLSAIGERAAGYK